MFAKVDIPAGTMVAQYTGHVMSKKEMHELKEQQNADFLSRGLSAEHPEVYGSWKYRFAYCSSIHACSLSVHDPTERFTLTGIDEVCVQTLKTWIRVFCDTAKIVKCSVGKSYEQMSNCRW